MRSRMIAMLNTMQEALLEYIVCHAGTVAYGVVSGSDTMRADGIGSCGLG